MPLSLENIQSKQLTIGVIGLGYVGFPLALAFAGQGVHVIGFDVDKKKIELIQQGKSYIQNIPDQQLQPLVSEGLFSVTDQYQRASECDAVIMCVPTPLGKHMDPDLQFIEATCHSLAPHITPHTLVALESTTWPGTTQEIVAAIFYQLLPKDIADTLYFVFSPEREDPGNPKFKTTNIPKLIGADDSKSLELGVALYKLAIDSVIAVNGSRVAEAAKLFENIFRSVNIALVNEMKIIMDRMGIDVWEVLKAAGTKPFGFMSFWPGPGLGGHCIPIDPFYLAWKAKATGMTTRFIELAGEINRAMPEWVVSKVQDCLNSLEKPLKGSKILILGLAYKADIADMRESPSLEIIRLLERKGSTVDYNDHYLPELPQNREYQELVGKKSQEPSKDYDCFLFATQHNYFIEEQILQHGVPIIDTRHFFKKHPLVFPA